MGNKATKRAFLNGINIATLEKVKLSQSRTGRLYIELTFTRKPQIIHGSKEQFAPLVDYLFFPSDKLIELCNAFGHELKPIPDAYPIVSYLRHVAQRINTFLGKELKVAVKTYNDVVKDDYGVIQKAAYINNAMLDKEVTRCEVINYYPVSDEPILDWNKWI